MASLTLWEQLVRYLETAMRITIVSEETKDGFLRLVWRKSTEGESRNKLVRQRSLEDATITKLYALVQVKNILGIAEFKTKSEILNA